MADCSFGAVFTKVASIFGATISLGIDYVLILMKIGLSYILGDFFRNSSGRPVPEASS
jgi:hypothetical protein